ncbi:MAG: tRNA guanosine(34) transglycosylase Tgt [Patescibacteria group bacterium]|jgi:queuine tRNA-ribosyltransferase
MSFKVSATYQGARAASLATNHGILQTPFFMPIATRGAVKHLANSDFATIQNQILLANTYHLYLRPGLEVLKKCGGLHGLMNWQKPILTDSGGFQVFSLAALRKITPDYVIFNSHIDGRELKFTPELSMEIQAAIGSDIQMCFDYFSGYPATRKETEYSVKLTTAWAKRCKYYLSLSSGHPSPNRGGKEGEVFGIVQGGTFPDLRKQSAQELVNIGFNGYAIGGLAVGETPQEMYTMIEAAVPELPADKPRYLMGVGQPEQILEAVKLGVDMFDCVLPTRNARHGQVYIHPSPLRRGEGGEVVAPDLSMVNYQKINLTGSVYATDLQPLDSYCQCSTCTSGYSRAYLRHLFSVNEALAQRLATVHNVYFYVQLMRDIRAIIMKSSHL